MNKNIIVGNFGEYEIKSSKPFDLNSDERTRNGKLRKKYIEAVFALEMTAFELNVDIADILPIKRK